MSIDDGLRYAFIDFETAEAADAALQMNGTDVSGVTIRVEKAMQQKLYPTGACCFLTCLFSGVWGGGGGGGGGSVSHQRTPPATFIADRR